MATKTESPALLFARSLAAGVLVSILFTYAAHVLGTWRAENYRPDSQTTYSLLLHNRCAVFNDTHTLWPNADAAPITDGIDGTKLGGSFLIFSEGHLPAMALIALVLGGVIFALRKKQPKTAQ